MIITPQIQLKNIIEQVCTEYGVTEEDIYRKEWQNRRYGISRRCPRNVSIAKQVISYLAKKLTGHSYKSIAVSLGYEGKSAAIKGYKLTKKVKSVDKAFMEVLEKITLNILKVHVQIILND